MKVVKEPISASNPVNNIVLREANKLKLPILPTNVSAPPHLLQLKGKCFNKTIKDYLYILCPFDNATQHEQSLKWNTYSGVIGVWKEWKIEKNTLREMLMEGGDECGPTKNRSTKVILTCSTNQHHANTAEITNATETATCEYLITLSTSLVCHPYSLKVYPFLPDRLKLAWDGLEESYQNGELTNQGYKRRLDEILIEANLLDGGGGEKMGKNKKNNNNNNGDNDNGDNNKHNNNNNSSDNKHKHNNNDNNNDDGFDSLDKCNEEYKKLLLLERRAWKM